MKEALFYEKTGDRQVRCGLCRFNCLIGDGKRGICAVRENNGGTLYSLVYGKVIAEHIDPIEKKPLFHVMPGSSSFSIATVGCNFHCRHCQNYSIAQVGSDMQIPGTQRSPAEIVQNAVNSGCSSIAYTYTEPTIFFEYAYDTAVLAKKAGLRNIFVTNGYITSEALSIISPFLDAANIDLKGFTEEFYVKLTGSHLKPILETLAYVHHDTHCWLEITTLLIPAHNDSDAEITALTKWVAQELGPDVPLHFSAFHPDWKMRDVSPTPASTLTRARRIALDAGLHYVYTGNVHDIEGGTTFCTSCHAPLIVRDWYKINEYHVTESGACKLCGAKLAGRFGKFAQPFGPRRIPIYMNGR